MRGFSLVEVAVVLLLLGILAATTAPTLARLGETDPVLDGAEQARTILRRARLTALDRGRDVEVVFVPESAHFYVWLPGDDPLPLAEGSLDVAPSIRIEATSPRPTFRFSPRGVTSGGAAVVVRGEGRAARVDVDPWTGEPSVREP